MASPLARAVDLDLPSAAAAAHSAKMSITLGPAHNIYFHIFLRPSSAMMIVPGSGAAAAALVIVTTLSNPSPPMQMPVLEVIKVYGHLAGPECFGSKAPPGSSCQMPLEYLKEELGLTKAGSISQEEFSRTVMEATFQWPLKPYGIDKSLAKTATMNKGAETKVYMDELERRGLYDRRNPTGPLPTSLRPKLNQQLEKENIDQYVVERAFVALNGGNKGDLTVEHLQETFRGHDALDYYSFLDLIGKDSVVWPQ